MHRREDVSNYPRPPHVEAVDQHAVIYAGGVVVCDTRDVVRVLETWHPPTLYLPRDAFDDGALRPAREPLTTTCEWKGAATYLDLYPLSCEPIERGAWTYAAPRAGFELLLDRVAVYPGRMERCELDGEHVTAQAGNFYGGWITSWIVGPIKGAPGTTHW
ncbi:MAG: hypothetical protein JWL76_1995 [Thermoleophilia bacterium]|nr:hypothetical protein [Thermoleophilia bacterium]